MRTLLLACLLGGCGSAAESPAVDAAPETIVAVDAPSAEDTAIPDSAPADTTTVADTSVDDTATADAGGVHYDPTVFALFSKSCAITGCHIGSAPAGTLGLADAKKGYDALMGTSSEAPPKKLVVPFDPSKSFLMSKLDHAMPPITSADKKLVETWIVDGAMY